MVGPLTRAEAGEVSKVASHVASKWPSVTREDVFQELWVWALRNLKWVERYRDREAEPYGQGKLNKALYRAGTTACVKEEAALRCRQRSELVVHDPAFTRPLVRLMLRFVWSAEDWPSPEGNVDREQVETARSMLIDVSNAVSRLNKRDQQILRYAFGEEKPAKALAEILGVSVDGAWKSKERALDRLMRYL